MRQLALKTTVLAALALGAACAHGPASTGRRPAQAGPEGPTTPLSDPVPDRSVRFQFNWFSSSAPNLRVMQSRDDTYFVMEPVDCRFVNGVCVAGVPDHFSHPSCTVWFRADRIPASRLLHRATDLHNPSSGLQVSRLSNYGFTEFHLSTNGRGRATISCYYDPAAVAATERDVLRYIGRQFGGFIQVFVDGQGLD